MYEQFQPMLFQNLFLQVLLFLFFSAQCLHDDYDVDYAVKMIINIIEFCVDPFYIYFNIITNRINNKCQSIIP